MVNIYKKGRGRNSTVTNTLLSEIKKIVELHGVDDSELTLCHSVQELHNLRDRLVDKYSLEVAPAETPPVETPPVETPTVETPEPTVKTNDYSTSQFVEISPENAFSAEFDPEDMYKVENDITPTTAEGEVEKPLPDPWEIQDKTSSRISAASEIKPETPAATNPVATPSSPSETTTEVPAAASTEGGAPPTEKPATTPEEDAKVALAEKTAKKATKSMARQSAKIFEFIVEWSVKKYSKIPQKKLDKLADEDLIDLHMPVDDSGKTVIQFVDEHNDLIDEMVKTDPDTRDELVDAIMLVAEKHKIKTSPESNLAMVVVTMLIGLGKAGHDQKKSTEKVLRKLSDNYVLGVKAVAEKDAEIARLKFQIDNPDQKTVVHPAAPGQPQTNEESEVSEIKSLSFGKTPTEQEKIEPELPSRNRKIEPISNTLETVTSPIFEIEPAKELGNG